MDDELDPAEQGENSEQEKRPKGWNIAPWQFKPGQSGNPTGRPKGPSLKVWAKNMIAAMDDKERQEFLKGLPKHEIWKMAEGAASTKTEVTGVDGGPIEMSVITGMKIIKDDGNKISDKE